LGSFLTILLLSAVTRLADAPTAETCARSLGAAPLSEKTVGAERPILSIHETLIWVRWLRILPEDVSVDFDSLRYFLSRFDQSGLRAHDLAMREAKRSKISPSRFERLKRKHELFRIPVGILFSMLSAITVLKKNAETPGSSFSLQSLNEAIDRYIYSLRKSWGFNIHHLARAGEIYAAAEMVERGYSLVKIGQLLMDKDRIMAEVDFLLKDPDQPEKFILGEVQVNAPGTRAWAGNQMSVRRQLLDGRLQLTRGKDGSPIEVSKVFIFVMRPSRSFLAKMRNPSASGFELTTFGPASQFARGSLARVN